jgi:hypothetical protein
LCVGYTFSYFNTRDLETLDLEESKSTTPPKVKKEIDNKKEKEKERAISISSNSSLDGSILIKSNKDKGKITTPRRKIPKRNRASTLVRSLERVKKIKKIEIELPRIALDYSTYNTIEDSSYGEDSS